MASVADILDQPEAERVEGERESNVWKGARVLHRRTAIITKSRGIARAAITSAQRLITKSPRSQATINDYPVEREKSPGEKQKETPRIRDGKKVETEKAETREKIRGAPGATSFTVAVNFSS